MVEKGPQNNTFMKFLQVRKFFTCDLLEAMHKIRNAGVDVKPVWLFSFMTEVEVLKTRQSNVPKNKIKGSFEPCYVFSA